MKKIILMLVLIFCAVPLCAFAQVTAVVNGQKISGDSFKQVTASALSSGNSLTDTITGVANAQGALEEIITGAISAGSSVEEVFTTALALGIPAEQLIKAHVAAGVEAPTIAQVARVAGVDQETIAKALGLQTPGLAYTPAENRVRTRIPSGSVAVGGNNAGNTGGFVSPSSL